MVQQCIVLEEIEMKYLVEIYEPDIDPGGYQKVIEVDTCCEFHAKR
jgi:hypothetical protein